MIFEVDMLEVRDVGFLGVLLLLIFWWLFIGCDGRGLLWLDFRNEDNFEELKKKENSFYL